jgi:hypothetical protein
MRYQLFKNTFSVSLKEASENPYKIPALFQNCLVKQNKEIELYRKNGWYYVDPNEANDFCPTSIALGAIRTKPGELQVEKYETRIYNDGYSGSDNYLGVLLTFVYFK